jgi:hypothetical protein
VNKQELLKQKAPFDVVEKGKKTKLTVKGFSENDPLGVGGGLFPDMPAVHFESGGWILVDDLLEHYDLIS